MTTPTYAAEIAASYREDHAENGGPRCGCRTYPATPSCPEEEVLCRSCEADIMRAEALRDEQRDREEIPCVWCGKPVPYDEETPGDDEHYRCTEQIDAEERLRKAVASLGADAHEERTEYGWERRFGSLQGAPEKAAPLLVWKLDLIASIALAATPETLVEIATIMRHDAAHNIMGGK